MNVALVDDEDVCNNNLKELLMQYGNCNFDIKVFNNGNDLLSEDIKKYDLIFLDIEMPSINGLELAIKLWEINKNVLIFYVSSYISFVTDAINKNAFTFISKPIIKEKLYMEIDRAIKLHNLRTKKINLAWNGEDKYIDIKDILYIESFNKICVVHTADLQSYKTSKKLSYYSNELKKYNFSQPSKSFLLNLTYVKQRTKNIVKIANCNYEIPISRKYKEDFLNLLNIFLNQVLL